MHRLLAFNAEPLVLKMEGGVLTARRAELGWDEIPEEGGEE